MFSTSQCGPQMQTFFEVGKHVSPMSDKMCVFCCLTLGASLLMWAADKALVFACQWTTIVMFVLTTDGYPVALACLAGKQWLFGRLLPLANYVIQLGGVVTQIGGEVPSIATSIAIIF